MNNTLNGVVFFAALLVCASCEEQVQLKAEGCVQCHQIADSDGNGIEIAHLRRALNCTDCHGGVAEATERGAAHTPESDANLMRGAIASGELSEASIARIKFMNPGDYHVADQACGACHGQIVARSKRSMHATNAGLVNIPRFEQGTKPSRPANLAIVTTPNPEFIPSIAPKFTYRNQAGISVPDITMTSTTATNDIVNYTLSKACSSCHLWSGSQDKAGLDGLYRNSGCSACHFEYNSNGQSESEDPNISPTRAPLPRKHQLVRNPQDTACQACHNTSNRIGLSYYGIREATEDEDLSQATVNSETLFGYPAGHLVLDEDGGDPRDNTPPDIHQSRGMSCVDCHFGNDVHGDGHIRPNMGAATGIECVDCHGTAEAAIAVNADGVLTTSAGDPFPYFVETDAEGNDLRNEDGNLRKKQRLRLEGSQAILTTIDGIDRPVPQLNTRLGNRSSLDAHSSANHGDLECYACHTSWMPNHYLSRLTIDLRETSLHPVTGEQTLGSLKKSNVLMSTGDLYLGVNVDGKIGTFMVDNQFLTVLAPCTQNSSIPCTEDVGTIAPARKLLNDYVGMSSEGRKGFSWRPSFAHTTASKDNTKRCEVCHLLSGGRNLLQVQAVFGLGSNNPNLQFTEPSSGKVYDLSQFVDSAGTSTVSLGTLLARPISPERLQRMLNLATP